MPTIYKDVEVALCSIWCVDHHEAEEKRWNCNNVHRLRPEFPEYFVDVVHNIML